MALPDNKTISRSVDEASARISQYIYKTPLTLSQSLSKENGCKVYLKLESEQITGSFKVRGAFNKLLLCCERTENQSQAFVTASTGNHGMASALALSTLKRRGVICVPTNISKAKEATLQLYDVDLEKHGGDCVETEAFARKKAEANGSVFISPYADLEVIYGQGTVAKEICQDLPKADAIYVAVGGGGLISGIAAYAKTFNPKIEIVGCLPEKSAVMLESVKAGRILTMESFETLSDATAGGIEEGSPTFPLCQRLVDTWLTVSEEEIARAVYCLLDTHHKVVEGSAGVALAGFLKNRGKCAGKNVVVVLCGSNIATSKLTAIVDSCK